LLRDAMNLYLLKKDLLLIIKPAAGRAIFGG
jgi:hypothetical protein